MKIYTKNGDQGETTTASGQHYLKSASLIQAQGDVDELNAFLGLLHTFRTKEVRDLVIDIQKDLCVLGAIISGATLKVSLKDKTKKLERKIDEMQEKLPELNNFIIPGGSRFSGYIHLGRAICRRAERSIVAAKEEIKDVDVLKYINRLADLLFVLARYVNFKLGVKEIIWESKSE